jgi:hypothetical protein
MLRLMSNTGQEQYTSNLLDRPHPLSALSFQQMMRDAGVGPKGLIQGFGPEEDAIITQTYARQHQPKKILRNKPKTFSRVTKKIPENQKTESKIVSVIPEQKKQREQLPEEVATLDVFGMQIASQKLHQQVYNELVRCRTYKGKLHVCRVLFPGDDGFTHILLPKFGISELEIALRKEDMNCRVDDFHDFEGLDENVIDGYLLLNRIAIIRNETKQTVQA